MQIVHLAKQIVAGALGQPELVEGRAATHAHVQGAGRLPVSSWLSGSDHLLKSRIQNGGRRHSPWCGPAISAGALQTPSPSAPGMGVPFLSSL